MVDHGSKQGWTDLGSSPHVQVHSVGWTELTAALTEVGREILTAVDESIGLPG